MKYGVAKSQVHVKKHDVHGFCEPLRPQCGSAVIRTPVHSCCEVGIQHCKRLVLRNVDVQSLYIIRDEPQQPLLCSSERQGLEMEHQRACVRIDMRECAHHVSMNLLCSHDSQWRRNPAITGRDRLDSWHRFLHLHQAINTGSLNVRSPNRYVCL